jgi:putative DNA primase/helicase
MPLPIDVHSIPEEMKSLRNWVLWKLEERDGKNTKIPYQKNGKRADSTNPDTWDSFEVVEQAFIRRRKQFSGMGFVFSEDAGIIGIDWDKVRDHETGEWNEEILEEIKSLNSYAELSQSGTGAHVLVKGEIPGDRRRKGNIEMYSKERFFVVTGSHIKGSPAKIRENQKAINELYKKRFGENEPKKKENKKQLENRIKLSNSEIIDIASRAKNSDKFKSLYNGNTSGYKSDSDADMAFCALLAFYTQEEIQIDSIFRSSGLYREKWEREDYRHETINKALQGVMETYNPNKKGKGKPEKIIVHFDEVADQIQIKNHLFSMRDNGQIYIYQDGVYRTEGIEAILGTKIRDAYYSMYKEKWKNINSDFDLPEHIPKATVRYVNEVLAYIRAYTEK